ncbi:bifunctional 3-(3-hydroxy-phenyl)propionate/3-hydroxycinnamic acid hydroxylase [Caulobacter sp. KR2-114]|uniref:bifunctional 3-(3-hydroxy-phenyl)propionate/3-hydroxycinnamic acid hydroxylase MhpA n=1 Tax=Caulobacter sp. KR2-114 TaxID=3400912 RepID=UPI003BFBDE57
MSAVADGAFDADVLVVGLGPVGAALAALLVRQGVRVIAVDRDTRVYPMPRAVHFDHEIMRLFQQLGVAEAVGRQARPVPAYEFRNGEGRLLMRLPPAPATPSGWASGYMFHQPSLETALREMLAASPLADVRLGVTLTGLAQDAEGVSADLAGPDGAATVRARWLIGCDGASSAVREAIGGRLSDYQFDEPWLVVDVHAEPGARLPEVNLQVCDPRRPTTCVLGGPGRHRWEFMLLPGETPEAMLDEAVVQALIAPWDCGPVTLERMAVYRFHGLVADRWRDGRVLLAGDSAHQTPPFAGQGMCSGLRDAANLAWKLAAVLRGAAGPALLDSYQAEREPNVRGYIELAIGMGRMVCTLDPTAAAERDAQMLARLDAGAPPLPPLRPAPMAAGCVMAGAPGAGELFPQPVSDGLRLDDVLEALAPNAAWLISREAQIPAPTGVLALRLDGEALALRLDGEALAPFRAELSTWLDAHEAEAVLVRPDRHVFGTGAPSDLVLAWARMLAAPEPAPQL